MEVRNQAKIALLSTVTHLGGKTQELEKIFFRLLSESSYQKVKNFLDKEPQQQKFAPSTTTSSSTRGVGFAVRKYTSETQTQATTAAARITRCDAFGGSQALQALDRETNI
jgi:hypothetical protein